MLAVKRLGMMMAMIALGVLVCTTFAQKVPQAGTHITVAKVGGMFSTIQAAVNVAQPGQVIEILDTEVYAEQVTIDGRIGAYTGAGGGFADVHHWGAGVVGGKYGITIRYVPAPGVAGRPAIRWQDTRNQSPRDSIEARNMSDSVGAAGNYETCGALRILRTYGVTIEGIIIDGVASAPYGYPRVWGGVDPMVHGNAAVAISVSGNIQIRDCELRNAYYGIFITDRNTGGIFANPNPHDSDADLIIPLSGFGKMGNHLIEYNKIHNNSAGIFSQSAWDLGSTIRYNLIYSNYHKPTTVFPAGLADHGDFVAGGIKFKDQYLSPVAIYNNTFHDNEGNIYGTWRVGYQHLIFNNIFGARRGSTNDIFFIEGAHPYRMKNSVFLQNLLPTTTLGTSFPTDVRALGMSAANFFQSITPTDFNFLEPNWSISGIQNGGWQESGIINEDGKIADIGAIPSVGKRPCDGRAQTSRVRITPFDAVTVNGTTATAGFMVNYEVGNISELSVKHARWIAPIPDNSYLLLPTDGGSWGNNGRIIPAASIHPAIPLTSTITPGSNRLAFSIPSVESDTEYGFIELVLQGKDGIGRTITSDVGFLPYRRMNQRLEIHVMNGDNIVSNPTVTVGQPVTIRVRAMMGGVAFAGNETSPLPIEYNLLSNPAARMWRDGDPLERDVLGTPGSHTATYTVTFTRAGNEVISAAAVWCPGACDVEGTYFLEFLGALQIRVLPEAIDNPVEEPARVVFLSPPSQNQGILRGFYPVEVQVQDRFGNAINTPVNVSLSADNAVIGFVANSPVLTNPLTGIVQFFVVAQNDAPAGVLGLTASINHAGMSASDVASLRIIENVGGGPDIVPRPNVLTGGYVSENGVIHTAQLKFSREVESDWFSRMDFAFGLIRGPMTNMGCILRHSTDPTSVLVILGCAFPGVTVTNAMGDNSQITINYSALNGWAPQTLTIANGQFISVLEVDRVPPPDPEDVAVVAPVVVVSGGLTAGPNPIRRGGNLSSSINFYRTGPQIKGGALTVYDALGNVVKKIRINDGANRGGGGGGGRDAMHCVSTLSGAEPSCIIGSWDLNDGNGRPVAEGTYLVRGEVVTRSGNRERVSVVVGVR